MLLDGDSLIEIRFWRVPKPVPPSSHDLKYSAVYIVRGERVVGYDNERGKGDHRHFYGEETRYRFTSMEQLLADFKADVEAIREDKI